jgi:hypothetical protein
MPHLLRVLADHSAGTATGIGIRDDIIRYC